MSMTNTIGVFDRDLINIHEYYELEHWSKAFGVSVEQLKYAVKYAGASVSAVKQFLNK